MVIVGNIFRNTVKSIVQLLDGKENTMSKMSNKEAKYWNDMIDKIAKDLGIDKIKKVLGEKPER